MPCDLKSVNQLLLKPNVSVSTKIGEKGTVSANQCCGSMTFWCGSGSGSADSCPWQMDPEPDADPDPAVFVIDSNIKLLLKIFCLLLFDLKNSEQ